MFKKSHLLIIAGFLVSMLFSTLVAPTASASNVKKIFTVPVHASQGATITKSYFLYTYKNHDDDVDIFKCKRSGDSIDKSSCKKIIEHGEFKHANVLDHEWGSNYFWVFNNGSPGKKSNRWCRKLSGKKADGKNCYKRSITTDNPSAPRPSKISQGFAIYDKYRLKAGYKPNYVYVYKIGKKGKVKKIRELPVGENDKELEDVMVDGDTGTIYLSLIKRYSKKIKYKGKTVHKKLHLYKYTKYTLPPISQIGDVPPDDSSDDDDDDSAPSTPVVHNPVSDISTKYQDDELVTNYFGTLKTDDDGCKVYMILNLILMVLTFGVTIAATVGIVISAITYMSSTSNEEQIAKAKKRILEIIIGLALYACLWSLANFLIPGGVFDPSGTCSF